MAWRCASGRSEDMEDARLVHFDLDAPKVVTEDIRLLDKDAHIEDVPAHMVEGTRFVASFAPAPGPGR